MGLGNTDFMQESREDERPHRQQFGRREWSSTSIATVAFILLALGCVAYYVRGPWDGAVTSPALTPAPAARTAPAVPLSTTPTKPARAPVSGESSDAVIRCQSNGATTYVAAIADCPQNSKTTRVDIDPKQNLSNGLPNAAQIIRQPSPRTSIETANRPSELDPNIQRKAACEAYEQEIKAIDIRARQPLSAQEQDWLTAKRRKARDEQFRLRC